MFRIIKLALLIIFMVNTASLTYAGDKHGVVKVEDLEIDLWVNKGEGSTYYYGEDLAIYFRTNDDCYVVVYDIDPEGNVSLIYPEDYSSSCFVQGGQVVRIPDVDDDYHLEIAGPSGKEHIYAVATYNRIDPPDFIRYEYFEYGNWDHYYDDFIHSVNGERTRFARDLNWRIAQGDHESAETMFFIDTAKRHHSWYRHWTYDPYYVGSVWVGTGYPGCEVWIDGIYWGIAPVLIPRIYVGRHWIWIYYNGYPCWQEYVYVNRGQRRYVDAKIGRRFLDFEYGRGNMRDWRFKYEVHDNEPGFAEKAEKARVKHVKPRRSAPLKVVEKYTRAEVNKTKINNNNTYNTNPVVNENRSTDKKSENRFKSYYEKDSDKQTKSSSNSKSKFKSSNTKKKSLNTKSGSTIIKNKSKDDDKEYKNITTKKSKSSSVKSSSSGSKKSKPASISKPKSTSKSTSSGKQKKSSGSTKKDKGKRSK